MTIARQFTGGNRREPRDRVPEGRLNANDPLRAKCRTNRKEFKHPYGMRSAYRIEPGV